MDTTIETIICIVAYSIQIGVLVLIAAVAALLLPVRWKRWSVYARLLALCLAVEVGALAYLAYHPIWICAEQYRPFISEEEKRELIHLNSGIYNRYIPITPVCIVVKSADEGEIVVTTWYAVFGRTEMSLTEDGPSLDQGLVN